MKTFVSIISRLMIVAIFLMSAVGNKIPNFGNVTTYMASEGVPMPSVMLSGAIVFLVVGGASVLVGYKAQAGAALLLIFLVLATVFFHDFWTFEGEARQQQIVQFLKNVSLMGTMLFLIVNGSGKGSLEDRRKEI